MSVYKLTAYQNDKVLFVTDVLKTDKYPEGMDIGGGWRIVRHRPNSKYGDMHVDVERMTDPPLG